MHRERISRCPARRGKSREAMKEFPQRLEPNCLQPLSYGLKPEPFKKPEFGRAVPNLSVKFSHRLFSARLPRQAPRQPGTGGTGTFGPGPPGLGGGWVLRGSLTPGLTRLLAWLALKRVICVRVFHRALKRSFPHKCGAPTRRMAFLVGEGLFPS
jgi:hypothetical protein